MLHLMSISHLSIVMTLAYKTSILFTMIISKQGNTTIRRENFREYNPLHRAGCLYPGTPSIACLPPYHVPGSYAHSRLRGGFLNAAPHHLQSQVIHRSAPACLLPF